MSIFISSCHHWMFSKLSRYYYSNCLFLFRISFISFFIYASLLPCLNFFFINFLLICLHINFWCYFPTFLSLLLVSYAFTSFCICHFCWPFLFVLEIPKISDFHLMHHYSWKKKSGKCFVSTKIFFTCQ